MNKKILGIALAVTAIGTSLIVSQKVLAQNTASTNPMDSLIQQLATKFGVKQNDVQVVFDQNRQDREVQMEKNFETKLTQDVSDSKITEAQKQLIITKRQELVAQRSALVKWATDNNIDQKYLGGGFGHGMGRGMGEGLSR
jgi:hypothetical protein